MAYGYFDTLELLIAATSTSKIKQPLIRGDSYSEVNLLYRKVFRILVSCRYWRWPFLEVSLYLRRVAAIKTLIRGGFKSRVN